MSKPKSDSDIEEGIDFGSADEIILAPAGGRRAPALTCAERRISLRRNDFITNEWASSEFEQRIDFGGADEVIV
jgi:hypothetical protein